jgi:septum formation protein
MARRLALAKARAGAAGLRRGFVLGADTVVILDGKPLGKPSSPAAARRMLRSLSGRWHAVVTALALLDPATGVARCGHARSRVLFESLEAAEIRSYVASGEPMDKAGAYALQGEGRALVRRWSGSPTNIIGLPLELLSRLLGPAPPE